MAKRFRHTACMHPGTGKDWSFDLRGKSGSGSDSVSTSLRISNPRLSATFVRSTRSSNPSNTTTSSGSLAPREATKLI